MQNRLFAFSRKIAWKNVGKKAVFILETVCCIVCGAIAVYMFTHRFLHLSSGFQYDELYSAVTASPELSFPFIWREMLLQDINLPLFNVLLFVWNRIFPYTQGWMHLFSALLGASAVVVAWFMAPKYWDFLKKWMFVTLMAGSFVAVCYGAIVRTYSLSLLLSTVFTLQALRIIRQLSTSKTPSRGTWLGFLGVGLLGAYSHYFCAGVFFITALVVFLYACYYKNSRVWAFWGTAVVFALWSIWLGKTFLFMSQPESTWWYDIPIPKAIWETITFLLGPRNTFLGILYGTVLALVSLIFTYRKSFFKQADIVLPLAQIILLCAVVTVVSHKYNLWLDRYFLPVMPSVFLLLAGFLHHLYKRHVVLLVLWPVLLYAWLSFFWLQDYLYLPEYTGLRWAFNYLVKEQQVDKVLIDMDRTGYPETALDYMMRFYIPKDKKLEIIRLTPQTAPLAWQTTPPTLVLMPICSQIKLLHLSVQTEIEEDPDKLLLFGKDVCVFPARPLNKQEAQI